MLQRPLLCVASLLAAARCAPSHDVKPGAPVLLDFGLQDSHGSPVSPRTDGGTKPVPPLLRAVALFDRLLDPAPLEALTDGGPAGKAGVARIEAAGGPATVITYTPNGDSRFHLLTPPGPSLTVAASPAFPSGSRIKISLDRASIRSKSGLPYDKGMGVMDELSFETEPFAATMEVPAAPPDGGPGGPMPVDLDFVVKIAFNNIPAGDIATHIQVTGVDAARVKVAVDVMDPTAVTVAPVDKWPAGARITVTIGAGAADALKMKIEHETSASFSTKQ